MAKYLYAWIRANFTLYVHSVTFMWHALKEKFNICFHTLTPKMAIFCNSYSECVPVYNRDVLWFLTLLVAKILVSLSAATSCFSCFRDIVNLFIMLLSDNLFISMTIIRLLNASNRGTVNMKNTWLVILAVSSWFLARSSNFSPFV